MRTILSLFVATLAAAQTPTEIERLEKTISDHPDNVGDRMNLLGRLVRVDVPLPPERVRESRRRHVLWLIEHHPEANIYTEPAVLIPVRGRLADPAGAAEVVALWKEIASQPDAKAQVVANAAIYLRALDLPAALALLNAHAADPAISRARGFVDAAAVIGLSGLGLNPQFSTAPTLRDAPEAKAALAELDASVDPYLIGSAGVALASGKIEISTELTIGEEDPLALADRWLKRAIELAPPGAEWKATLVQELQGRAGRMVDPQEKTRLLREAQTLVAEPANAILLMNLSVAEFDAGDDAAAESDAQALLATAPKNANAYHAAQTVLGRIAAAKGDLVEAKRRLTASVTMPPAIKSAAFQPNMALAQDIYDAGGQDAVVEFLGVSRAIWKNDQGRIDRMISFVKKAPSADLTQLSRQPPGNEMLRQPAPSFEAKDLDGKTWTREQLTGKVVALEFGNAPLAEKVAKDFAARGVVLVKTQDSDTKGLFEVLTDPTVVVIDRQGTVSGYRAGVNSEDDWRRELESGFGQTDPKSLPAPRQSETTDAIHRRATLAWEPVDNAASYVVEWDSRDLKGWIFDRDRTVLVIPTSDLSATLDLTGFTRVRWRVYAVPKTGPAGTPSPWMEIAGFPVIRSFK